MSETDFENVPRDVIEDERPFYRKQAYRKPSLRHYGTVSEVTKTVGPKLNNPDGGKEPNHKTQA